MKATGVVRRIDDLGRVVIPKEVRRTLHIRNGDPLEIFTDREGRVILKKYSPVVSLEGIAKEYVQTLHEATGHISFVTDMDMVVATAGARPKGALDRSSPGPVVTEVITGRKPRLLTNSDGYLAAGDCVIALGEGDTCPYTAGVIAPIVSEQGDALGAVILCAEEPGAKMGDLELKLAHTAASFLARQLQ